MMHANDRAAALSLLSPLPPSRLLDTSAQARALRGASWDADTWPRTLVPTGRFPADLVTDIRVKHFICPFRRLFLLRIPCHCVGRTSVLEVPLRVQMRRAGSWNSVKYNDTLFDLVDLVVTLGMLAPALLRDMKSAQ